MASFSRGIAWSRNLATSVVAATALCFASIANATFVSDGVNNTTSYAYYDGNIRSNDLIENGSVDVASTVTTGNMFSYSDSAGGWQSGNWSSLTDGAAGHYSWAMQSDLTSTPSPSITYNFDIADHPLGYTLTSIQTIYGWVEGPCYSNQRYDVAIAMVGSPTTFTQLATVDYQPFAADSSSYSTPNASQFTLTDSTGKLSAGVAAIRFTFLNNTNYGGGADGQFIHEIDIVGGPTIPEPGTILLFLTGLIGLIAYTWRKRS